MLRKAFSAYSGDKKELHFVITIFGHLLRMVNICYLQILYFARIFEKFPTSSVQFMTSFEKNVRSLLLDCTFPLYFTNPPFESKKVAIFGIF